MVLPCSRWLVQLESNVVAVKSSKNGTPAVGAANVVTATVMARVTRMCAVNFISIAKWSHGVDEFFRKIIVGKQAEALVSLRLHFG